VAAFLSLGLPAHLSQKWVDGFFKGFDRLAKRFGVTLAGGDIATSPEGISADIVVLGRVPKGKAILRSGARPDDLIYVSGVLGGSAEMLANLKRKERRSSSGSKISDETVSAHYFPQPRIKIGQWLREHHAATAMIDISDGLSNDLWHICEESGVAAVIEREAIPRARLHRRSAAARLSQEDAQELGFALHGGEDYELLFTVSRSQKMPSRIMGIPITKIGEILSQTKGTASLRILHNDGTIERLHRSGWEHFSNSSNPPI